LYLTAREKERAGDPAGAAASIQTLLEREPDNVHLMFYRTQWLQAANQPDAAIAALSELAKRESVYRIPAINDLAYLLAEHQPDRMDEAYRMATEAYEKAPRFHELADTVGWIAHLRGDDQKALRFLNQALATLGTRAEVHYHTGVVYAKLGNPAWSSYHLTEAAESPDPELKQRVKAALGI
jgi:cellulose synthase operon protein C